jgi:cytosine/adenosine deaminase-related metal-dependent hydrolase
MGGAHGNGRGTAFLARAGRAHAAATEGNRITLVGETDGSMRPETPDDTVIDATGKVILPGPLAHTPSAAQWLAGWLGLGLAGMPLSG